MTKKLLAALALSVWIVVPSANATLTEQEEVSLPKPQRDKLERLICKDPFNIKAEIIRGYKNDNAESKADFDSAYVKCEAHGKFMGVPIYYQTYCWNDDAQWRCNSTELETTIHLAERNIKVRPWGMSLETAYQTIYKISSYGNFQGIPMSDAIGSSCDVIQLKDHETIELSCAYKITLSAWCPQPELTKCPRVVFVAQQPVP